MKGFLYKIVLFSIFALLLLETIAYAYRMSGLFEHFIPGAEVYLSIRKSKQKTNSNVVLIGDSVGQQMFSNKQYFDKPYSLACNQAVSFAGYYFLLNNFIKAGNEVDSVLLFCSPFSFDNNLNQIFTYHYFLKPFGRSPYKSDFTNTVNTQIAKLPYHQIASSNCIAISKWAPLPDQLDTVDFSFMSPVASEYLTKIKQLSLAHNFKFIMVPAPTKNSNKKEIANFDKKEYLGQNYETEIISYFDRIRYIDDKNFSDKIHLINPDLHVGYYKETYSLK